jgi:hypothetical protein
MVIAKNAVFHAARPRAQKYKPFKTIKADDPWVSLRDLSILLQPGADFIVASGHHQMQPIRFDEKKNNPDAARDSKFKCIIAQSAQAQARVNMRLSDCGDKLSKPLIDLLDFGVRATLDPTLPACS